MPKRIQRKRTKGWRMPDGAVYVGRPTKWGNPISWRDLAKDDGYGDAYARQVAMEMYDDALAMRDYPGFPTAHEARTELAGRDLACWCPLDQPCHADVLLEIANDEGA